MLRHPGESANRLGLNPPSRHKVETNIMSPDGKMPVHFTLQNLPLYMVGRLNV